MWKSQADVLASPSPSVHGKRPLESDENNSSYHPSNGSPAVSRTAHTQGSTPTLVYGSPTKKARLAEDTLPTPTSSQTNGSFISPVKAEDQDPNPFIAQPHTPVPSTSIFASMPASAKSPYSPSKNISAQEVRTEGFSFIESVTRQMTKLENRERAAQQRGERFKTLYESEKRKNEDLTKMVEELERKVTE